MSELSILILYSYPYHVLPSGIFPCDLYINILRTFRLFTYYVCRTVTLLDFITLRDGW